MASNIAATNTAPQIMTPYELALGMGQINENELLNKMRQQKIFEGNRAENRRQALASLYQQSNGNPTAIRQGLINQGMGDTIPEYDQQQREVDKETRLSQRDTLKNAIEQTGYVAQKLSSFVGQPYSPQIDQAYQQTVAQIQQELGKELPNLPKQYNQDEVSNVYKQGMGVAQQLSNQWKSLNFGYQQQQDQQKQAFDLQKFGYQQQQDQRNFEQQKQSSGWVQTVDQKTGLPIWTQGRTEGMPAYSPTGISNKPMTEAQGKANIFGQRAQKSNEILNKYENNINVPGLATKQWLGGGIVGAAANTLLSDEQQKVDQAQRDFLNAALRNESGALISKEDIEGGRKQYFPQTGERSAVISQKRQNREMEIKGLLEMAGPNAPSNNSSANSNTAPLPNNTQEQIPDDIPALIKKGWTPEYEAEYVRRYGQ